MPCVVLIGNHLKMTLARGLRDRCLQFYSAVLECKVLDSPMPDLDLYEFAGGFVVGLFFRDGDEVLSETDYLKATWLELKTEDPLGLKERLLAFGVEEVVYPDPSRFFFRAPGGQVFRVAPIDGGL